ncbi:Alpha-2-macroglobulin receptor-associated protein [Chionoecetes opilio]|uniref:Alpha-2-macroglobulin receptor-associated protein n=1 Tax=Chionoecetes opilio TaxID=41210 RepID=A0A8J5D0E5_CHIOP|nr:Alpha-2-macroglobulin receptor-associated protein [Chionoecetes opilio]
MAAFRVTLVLVVMVWCVLAFKNKYTEEANTVTSLKTETTPFRMGKLNMLWEKAVKRLAEPKLKRLLSELKVQDKEELTLKKLKGDGMDKEGLKEADLRKKLRNIMEKFGLNADLREDNLVDSISEAHMNDLKERSILKAIFKDKKLNRLWTKAEASGFTEVELKALKEEFQHHQDKVDEYYALVQDKSQKHEDDENHLTNDIKKFDLLQDLEASDKAQPGPTNTIKEKHQDLKSNMDRLHKLAVSGPDGQEFFEPKVSKLWNLAIRGDFTKEELESLHTELKHYEHRLLKVRHMTGQMDLLQERAGDDIEKLQSSEGQLIMQERLAKHQRTIEKLHEDLEMKIVQRHLEF